MWCCCLYKYCDTFQCLEEYWREYFKPLRRYRHRVYIYIHVPYILERILEVCAALPMLKFLQFQRASLAVMFQLYTSLEEQHIQKIFSLLTVSAEELRLHGNIIKRVVKDRFLKAVFSPKWVKENHYTFLKPSCLFYMWSGSKLSFCGFSSFHKCLLFLTTQTTK